MAAEPLVIYSHKIDPKGVLTLLRSLDPTLKVEGPEDNWSTITITRKRGFLKKHATLTFGHAKSYYTGPDWPNQMRGMQGYFSRFPKNERTPRIILLISSFQFSLTLFPVPQPDLYIDDLSDDHRQFLLAVVKHLDGVIFTPSSLRDAQARILYGPKDPDPAATMPEIYKSVPVAPRTQRTISEGGTLPDPNSPPPPTADRVARRALALSAVTARGLLEQEDPKDPGVEQTRQRLVAWVADIGIQDELEPDESKILQHPLGTPPKQDSINACWRLEGLAILAWALNRFPLLPIDELVTPAKLFQSLGFLNPDRAKALLAEPALRDPKELDALAHRLFALHWRIRNHRLKPQHMDFADFAKTAWFGPLNITDIRLIDNDLALGDTPIAKAPPNTLAAATSAAAERHLAINWLTRGSLLYSKTDTST